MLPVQLPAHTRERIGEIRATHKPMRRWFRKDVCKMCGQTWECTQIVWASDVEAGRRTPAGMPL